MIKLQRLRLLTLTAWLAAITSMSWGDETTDRRSPKRSTRIEFAADPNPVCEPDGAKSFGSSNDANEPPGSASTSAKINPKRRSESNSRIGTRKNPKRQPVRRVSASSSDIELAPVVTGTLPPMKLELDGPEYTAQLPDPIQTRRELPDSPLPDVVNQGSSGISDSTSDTGPTYLESPDLSDLFSSPGTSSQSNTGPSAPAGSPAGQPSMRSPSPAGGPPSLVPRSSTDNSTPQTGPTSPNPTSPEGVNPNRRPANNNVPPSLGNDNLFDDINPFQDDEPSGGVAPEGRADNPFDTPFGNPLTGQVGADGTADSVNDAFSSLGIDRSPGEGVAGNTPLASIPHVMGDFFDGGTRTVQFRNAILSSFHTTGQRISTAPDVFAFERDAVGFPDDFFTVGPGSDTNDDGIVDTYAISEPLAPNDVPTSPGAQYAFDGGTAIFTNDTTSTTPPQDVTIPVSGNSNWFASYSFSQLVTTVVPAAGGGVAVRRFKIAENNSPLPQDRFFFNYSFFNDVATNLGDVSRYTLGFEKTHWEGLASWELRLPFAGTVDHEQTIDAPVMRNFEFGNLMFSWKGLFYFDDNYAVASGLGITIPTANDTGLSLSNGQRLLSVRNDAVHFLPYIAASRTLGQRGFAESFVQFDFDANGNKVYANTPTSGVTGFPRIGRLNDSSFLFVDAAFGYWLYQNDMATWVNGIAPIAEFHYSSTITDADLVAGNGVTVTDNSQRTDILNLTLGTHLKLRSKGRVAVGATIPLRDGDDDPFDYEFLVQANRLF